MSALEKNVAKLYEDIHPFIDVEQTIDDYLETLRIGPEFFKGKNILDCGFGGTGWAVELCGIVGVPLGDRAVRASGSPESNRH